MLRVFPMPRLAWWTALAAPLLRTDWRITPGDSRHQIASARDVRNLRASLEKAIAERKPPPGLLHHSDRGVQYASEIYVTVLRKLGTIPSMGGPNPYDN